MIMTPEDMRPTVGQPYRHRRSGRVATLRRWGCMRAGGRTNGLVQLTTGDGWEWFGCEADFWNEWLHAGAFDESRN